jgi:hypothetical protein
VGPHPCQHSASAATGQPTFETPKSPPGQPSPLPKTLPISPHTPPLHATQGHKSSRTGRLSAAKGCPHLAGGPQRAAATATSSNGAWQGAQASATHSSLPQPQPSAQRPVAGVGTHRWRARHDCRRPAGRPAREDSGASGASPTRGVDVLPQPPCCHPAAVLLRRSLALLYCCPLLLLLPPSCQVLPHCINLLRPLLVAHADRRPLHTRPARTRATTLLHTAHAHTPLQHPCRGAGCLMWLLCHEAVMCTATYTSCTLV